MTSSPEPVLSRLADRARRELRMTRQELWLAYLALGGTADLLELDAFLHGLAELAESQHDVLAHALNERLVDSASVLRLPYRSELDQPPSAVEPPPEGEVAG